MDETKSASGWSTAIELIKEGNRCRRDVMAVSGPQLFYAKLSDDRFIGDELRPKFMANTTQEGK